MHGQSQLVVLDCVHIEKCCALLLYWKYLTKHTVSKTAVGCKRSSCFILEKVVLSNTVLYSV